MIATKTSSKANLDKPDTTEEGDGRGYSLAEEHQEVDGLSKLALDEEALHKNEML